MKAIINSSSRRLVAFKNRLHDSNLILAHQPFLVYVMKKKRKKKRKKEKKKKRNYAADALSVVYMIQYSAGS